MKVSQFSLPECLNFCHPALLSLLITKSDSLLSDSHQKKVIKVLESSNTSVMSVLVCLSTSTIASEFSGKEGVIKIPVPLKKDVEVSEMGGYELMKEYRL